MIKNPNHDQESKSWLARLCSLTSDQPPADKDANKEVVMTKAEILSQILEEFLKSLDEMI